MAERLTPEIMTELRKDIVRVPEIILEASGIKIFGRPIRSTIFATDIVIMRNTNANAVIAAHPLTPHPTITESIIEATDIPVFFGVEGGLTQGAHSSYMSTFAEARGSLRAILNGPTPLETVGEVYRVVDIPAVNMVTSRYTGVNKELMADISIIDISAREETVEIVRHFRKKYPELPTIATGGPTEENIAKTTQVRANAITYTSPSSGKLFSRRMEKYQETGKGDYE